jgi:hypothetical protein
MWLPRWDRSRSASCMSMLMAGMRLQSFLDGDDRYFDCGDRRRTQSISMPDTNGRIDLTAPAADYSLAPIIARTDGQAAP